MGNDYITSLLDFCNNSDNDPVKILEREIVTMWKGSDKHTTDLFYNHFTDLDFKSTEKKYNTESVKATLKISYNAYICYILGTFHERGADVAMAHINVDRVKSYINAEMMQCVLWTGSVKSCPSLMNYTEFHQAMISKEMPQRQYLSFSPAILTAVKLLLSLAYICFDENSFKQIYDNWINATPSTYISVIASFKDCFDVSLLDNSFDAKADGVIYRAMKGGVRNQFDKKTIENKKGGSVSAGGSIIEVSPESLTLYGFDVIKWIEDLEYRDKFGISKGPSPQAGGTAYKIHSGCVVEGTMIKMFEQKEKAIEMMKPGDLVLNKTMCASICSEELIQNDKVDEIYSINDDEPFMSLEHAIFTLEKGWCSLDPYCSNRINPRWNVQKLSMADHVLKINERNEMYYEQVKRINITKNQKTCYELHFYEGSNSYFANGYANLLIYPVLTLTGVMEALQSNDQLEDLKKNWEIIAPLLKSILYPDALEYIKKAMERTDNHA